ncbi:hypothetical protein G7046_g4014 [Stylonectria norvegica]|nr:hypothetical protein G7046_g4014 [Stylonectria norvegica]
MAPGYTPPFLFHVAPDASSRRADCMQRHLNFSLPETPIRAIAITENVPVYSRSIRKTFAREQTKKEHAVNKSADESETWPSRRL